MGLLLEIKDDIGSGSTYQFFSDGRYRCIEWTQGDPFAYWRFQDGCLQFTVGQPPLRWDTWKGSRVPAVLKRVLDEVEYTILGQDDKEI